MFQLYHDITNLCKEVDGLTVIGPSAVARTWQGKLAALIIDNEPAEMEKLSEKRNGLTYDYKPSYSIIIAVEKRDDFAAMQAELYDLVGKVIKKILTGLRVNIKIESPVEDFISFGNVDEAYSYGFLLRASGYIWEIN